jgi:hypothetical protein
VTDLEGYEIYQALWRITGWKDGCVYSTQLVAEGWYDSATVEANRPNETNLTYCTSTSDSTPVVQIRRKRRD